MALQEIRQGGTGIPPNNATFWVTYDDVTLRIESIRCENNTAYVCRMVFFNSASNKTFGPFDVNANSTRSYTFKNNEDYSLADDEWGYTMMLLLTGLR